MLFNSIPFLIFAPIFLVCYFVLWGSPRLLLCLVASYLFYGWWDWRFLTLIGLSTLIDYRIGWALGRATDPKVRKRLLTLSCCLNLGLLGFFKYFNFFLDSFYDLLAAAGVQASPTSLDIILPVGISFYTFQTMSYTIDIYRGRLKPEPSLIRFAVFVAFFPQLVAGPIVRASSFLPQLRRKITFDWSLFVSGFYLVLWGYCLKIVVADSLAPFVDHRFASPGLHSSLSLQLAVLFYSFQIYADFCGYSSIAIGLARMLGFDFGINFNRPYLATSLSDFWQRWHISLSTWLRDYLYIPLGGNRHGTIRTYRNLLITMLLGGLWHGAAWGFVLWGALHGSYLIVQRLASTVIARVVPAWTSPTILSLAAKTVFVFVAVSLAWIPFRARSFQDAQTIYSSVLTIDLNFALVTNKFLAVKGLLLVVLLYCIDLIASHMELQKIIRERPWLSAFAAACMLWALGLFGAYDQQTFIYFQF